MGLHPGRRDSAEREAELTRHQLEAVPPQTAEETHAPPAQTARTQGWFQCCFWPTRPSSVFLFVAALKLSTRLKTLRCSCKIDLHSNCGCVAPRFLHCAGSVQSLPASVCVCVCVCVCACVRACVHWAGVKSCCTCCPMPPLPPCFRIWAKCASSLSAKCWVRFGLPSNFAFCSQMSCRQWCRNANCMELWGFLGIAFL